MSGIQIQGEAKGKLRTARSGPAAAERGTVSAARRTFLRRAATAALLLGAGLAPAATARAQELDFGQIDKFESLGTGTLHVGEPPKTIVDDGDRHTVFLTIYEADARTKVYWKSLDDGAPRTTVIPGRGVQAFQTAGLLRLEAVGEPAREVKYGYVLLRLKNR